MVFNNNSSSGGGKKIIKCMLGDIKKQIRQYEKDERIGKQRINTLYNLHPYFIREIVEELKYDYSMCIDYDDNLLASLFVCL